MNKDEDKLSIFETIVVEGKDDLAAIKAAVDCSCIITHGLGFGEDKLKEIEDAAARTGIIIFTDPDYAGEKIRRKIRDRVPDAKHAYLNRKFATRRSDIGLENASVESIKEALKRAKASLCRKREEFSQADFYKFGLTAGLGAKEKRIALAEKLGISYGNSKKMLDQLNHYGISRREFEEAMGENGDLGENIALGEDGAFGENGTFIKVENILEEEIIDKEEALGKNERMQ